MSRELKTWRDVIQAILDSEEVEFFGTSGVWVEFHHLPCVPIKELSLEPNVRCRIKPHTIQIGSMEVPEPVWDASEFEDDEVYFAPSVGSEDFYTSFEWYGDNFDLRMLSRGFAHKTKEAAILHSKALIKISGGNYE